ncbi:MAG: ABC transporter permease [Gemmatirosa sp.]|nr:ABC transporter permease [Gemmatirosa sp.]
MRREPVWRRVARLWGPDVRADVDDELAFHVQMRADELVRDGWSPDAARARALASMGDVDGARRECLAIGDARHRRRRWRERLASLGTDLRVGARTLRRGPGFAAIALLTLALSIGATTAIFGLVDGVLLRPLRVDDPDRLVTILARNAERGIDESPPSGPDFVDWRAESRSFSGMAGFRYESFTLTGGADGASADVLTGAGASASFFEVLGVRPVLGRTFRAGEDVARGVRVVVLSYAAWQQRLGGAPDVVGRAIDIDREPYEIVGVMPRGFAFPAGVEMWRPSDMTYAVRSAGMPTGQREDRGARYIGVVARLRPGVTIPRASQEMESIAAELATRYPVENRGWHASVVSLRSSMVRHVEPVLLLVLAAVALVLLIGCANVANLTLGRALGREAEMALRAALGAGRARLHVQMLAESVVLGVAGGALGVALAWGALRAFVRLAPASLPRLDEVAIDGRVLAFALVVSVGTGLLFGLAPALRLAGTSAATVLREAGRGGAGGRRSERVRRALVVGEVALAVLLLVGAGLTLRSVVRLLAVDAGYATQDVVAAHVSLDGPRYDGNAPKARYLRELARRVAALPGVERVGVTTTIPLTRSGIDFDLEYHAEGHAEVPREQAPSVDYRMVSPGYLEAMGMRLRDGRAFDAFDRLTGDSANGAGRRVMLVNEAFARLNWPGQRAVGKRVRLYYFRTDPWEVVGVVGDTRHADLATPPRPQVFVPIDQAELLFGYMTLVARTRPGAKGVISAMRAAAAAIDPSEPLYEVQTIETLRAAATTRDRLTAAVLGAFAGLAVLLAAAGIYGVIAYQVVRRTREIGVRIALGASAARVVRDVVREAAALALVGVGLGTLGALAAARAARGLLFGVSPTDPLTFGAVVALLLGVAVVAALVPASRAARIRPVEALRAD